VRFPLEKLIVLKIEKKGKGIQMEREIEKLKLEPLISKIRII